MTLLLVLSLALPAASQAADAPLGEALRELVARRAVPLVYAPELVAGRRTACPAETRASGRPAPEVLACILDGTGLVSRRLPSGAYALDAAPPRPAPRATPRPAGVAPERAARRVVLRGFVSDAETGGPLPGAAVTARRLGGGAALGATADGDGFYEVGPLAPGRYAVRVSFVGYGPAVDTVDVEGGAAVTYSVGLRPAPGVLGEVVVVEEAGAVVEGGVQAIRPADLARVPTPGGSGDLAGYLTTLPSVVATGDTGGQLYVRGGTPSQNLVLVDGAPVFQPFHAVGAFSAFPEDLVGSVDFYGGGFGVRYNGRVSSVLDVTTRNGRTDRLGAAAEAGPFVVGGRVEGPVGRGGASFLVSARRSVIEAVAPVLLGRDVPLAFSDVHVKLAQRDAGGTCTATALYTDDQGRVDPERGDGFGWTNAVLGGRCVLAPAATAVRFETNLSGSYVGNRAGTDGDPERTSAAYLLNADVDLSRLTAYGRVRLGAYGRLVRTSYALGEQYTTVREGGGSAVTAGAYAEAEVALGAGLSATGGALVSVRPFTTALAVEPRGRLAWRPAGDGGVGLDLAGGLYRQSLLGVQDERDAGSPFTAWLQPPVGDAEAVATHAVAGATLPLGPLRLGAEAYWKRTRRQPVPVVSAAARFTTALTLADATAQGVDLRAELRRGPFYGFVGYGYGAVEYRAAEGAFGTVLGEPVTAYRPPHDRRHQLSALASVRRGPWAASARWQGGAGLPFTRVVGFDDATPVAGYPDFVGVPGTPRVLFDRPYGGRLPAYHRLDVSAERAVRVGASRLTVRGGAVNVYDRANVLYYDVFRLRRVDQLPLVPYLAVRLETGR